MGKEEKTIKIAVIEDETDLSDTIKMRLESEGFSVVQAFDGISGLELIKKEKPDLVILDIMMPRMDGRDTIKNLKSDPGTKNIPVIMLTALGEQFNRIEGLGLGAYEYITKPFDAYQLIRQINRLLEKRGKGEVS
ncbi:MAG: response regulator [Candidatus Omnitrophota bacterium]